MSAPLPRAVRAALVVAAAALLFLAKARPDSWADGSRLGTIQGLVEHGTLALDDTDFLWQGDRVRIGGRYFSHQPPMLALLGALPYAALHHGLGLTIRDPWTYRVLVWVLVGLPVWLGLVALARLLVQSGCGERGAALLLLLALFGTHLLPWSLVLAQHGTAAGLVLLGFGLVARGRTASAGAAMALAATVDLTAVFPALALALPCARLAGLDGFLRYALGALPPLGLHFGVNLSLTGDLLPAGLHFDAFRYPYSPFMLMSLTGDAHRPGEALVYAWRALLGYSGFFSHHPAALLALLLGADLLRRRPRTELPGSLLVAAGASVVGIVAYYLASSRNFGGSAFGMRWFAVFSPLLALFPAAWLGARAEPWRPGAVLRAAVALLCLWSVAGAALGAVQPWAKFHFTFAQRPESLVASPERVPPTWREHLRREWAFRSAFRQRFDRDDFVLTLAEQIDRHGRARVMRFPAFDETQQRAWTQEGLERLRPVVDLLDGTQEASPPRTVGHYWLGRLNEALGELAGAAAQYRKTLELEPGHGPATRALERVRAALQGS